jgi:haloacetate dehalogenase
MDVENTFNSLDDVQVNGTSVHARTIGIGPPLLLLHGFPQTNLMWRKVAKILANKFTVICSDLRGYGNSACPPSTSDHLPYSKRVMAQDMIQLMERLGFSKFFVAGHDRGGRVAYRMALDYPEKILAVSVLDIIPTLEVWDRADKRFALDFWPWSLLSQPEPLPEKLMLGSIETAVNDALQNWGTPAHIFDQDIRKAYYEALNNYSNIHAICEEYRAGAGVDYEHDLDDRKHNRRITCPLQVLWGTYLNNLYGGERGVLSIWRTWADKVSGTWISAGHFFPEEKPKETAAAFLSFFSR